MLSTQVDYYIFGPLQFAVLVADPLLNLTPSHVFSDNPAHLGSGRAENIFYEMRLLFCTFICDYWVMLAAAGFMQQLFTSSKMLS